MRRFVAMVAAVGCIAAFGGRVAAAPMTVKGQVVDEGCSTKGKTEHKDGEHRMAASMTDCAIECAKKGEPLALLTSDGKVYRITGGLAANKNAKLIPHMTHIVEITGEVSEKDGKVEIASDTLEMVSK